MKEIGTTIYWDHLSVGHRANGSSPIQFFPHWEINDRAHQLHNLIIWTVQLQWTMERERFWVTTFKRTSTTKLGKDLPGGKFLQGQLSGFPTAKEKKTKDSLSFDKVHKTRKSRCDSLWVPSNPHLSFLSKSSHGCGCLSPHPHTHTKKQIKKKGFL